MAVSLSTIKDEVLSDLQESATASRPLYTSADFIGWANRFYGQYGARMKLQGVTDYTWPANTKSVSISTIGSTILQVNRIEILDSDGNITGTLEPKPKGSAGGFFVWNNALYLNGSAPSSDVSMRFYHFRKPTLAAAIENNADVHDGFERSVLNPWFIYCAYRKAKQFSRAALVKGEFDEAFRDMMKDRSRQANPDFTGWEVHADYEPYTG